MHNVLVNKFSEAKRKIRLKCSTSQTTLWACTTVECKHEGIVAHTESFWSSKLKFLSTSKNFGPHFPSFLSMATLATTDIICSLKYRETIDNSQSPALK